RAGGSRSKSPLTCQPVVMTVWMTWLFSKNTTKPGYSQRVMGGCCAEAPPTGATRLVGAPYFASTESIDMPLAGVALVAGDALIDGTCSSSARAEPHRTTAAAAETGQDVERMDRPLEWRRPTLMQALHQGQARHPDKLSQFTFPGRLQ